MHPTPAAKQSQLCSNSTARRGYRDCLPTPIHSSKSFTTCLVFLPVATYQPIPSHLSCACAALRSQSQSQSHSFPPSLIPRPFFRPSPAELGDSAPKEASQPVRRPLPPPLLHLPRYSTGRSGSTTPRPCSSSQLPPSPTLLRLGSTRLVHSYNHHQRPPTLSPPPRSSLKLCTRHSSLSACRCNHQTGIRQAARHTGQADEHRRQRGPAWRAFRRDRAWPATAAQWPQTRQQKLATAQLAVEATVLTRGR